jgi:hypothetical protein
VRRTALVLTLVGAVTLTPTNPAPAGGWWSFIDLGRSFAAHGETLQIEEDILFDAHSQLDEIAPARSGEHPYFGYLIDEIDRKMLDRAMSRPFNEDWWEPPADAVQVGTVTFDRWDSNLAWAHLDATIPEVPSGRYWFMLCDLGCIRPLADAVPSEITIVPDRSTGRLMSRLQALKKSVNERLGPLEKSNASVWARANRAHERITGLETEVAGLERALARNEDEPHVSFAWFPFLGGLTLAAALLRIRRRRA